VTTTLFSTLALDAEMLSNIQSLGYQEMTPIQEQSLPAVLAGKDVLAQAMTGSGKTAAFGIGVLHKLDVQNYQTQALVLCPTRELADQVSNELRRLARSMPNTNILSLCGGKPMGPQLASLERNPHVIVGTPGRVLKHMQKGSLTLKSVNTLVLDEADRMLDMGFQEEIMKLISEVPKKRQTLLFSATYPDDIQKISRSIQKNPLTVQVESLHDAQEIEQICYELKTEDRTAALIRLLQYYKPESSIVFCNRKDECQQVANTLSIRGFHALAIHGDLEQKERVEVLAKIANKSSSVLIATDVAARGLDIKELSAVINYELCRDPQVHVHRIGRTGRAGSKGLALSLFMPSEIHRFNAIEEYQKSPLTLANIDALKVDENFSLVPPMVTLCIQAGRKKKLRAGDILGALTSNTNLPGKKIGKIDLFDHYAYVAVERAVAKQALKILSENKIKGRSFKVRKL